MILFIYLFNALFDRLIVRIGVKSIYVKSNAKPSHLEPDNTFWFKDDAVNGNYVSLYFQCFQFCHTYFFCATSGEQFTNDFSPSI